MKQRILNIVKPYRPVQDAPYADESPGAVAYSMLTLSHSAPPGSLFEITADGMRLLVRRWRWQR